MVEVVPGVFIGSAQDLSQVDGDWYVLHAAKTPWHEQFVGYKGKAPRNEEYLSARRGQRLALNFVDGDDWRWIHPQMMGDAVCFIDEAVVAGKKILVHCNEGRSRGPTVVLIWLLQRAAFCGIDLSSQTVLDAFLSIYPEYAPRAGCWGYIRNKVLLDG